MVATPLDPRVASWITAVVDRHERLFAPHEFFRAIRAVSARYVERRHTLRDGGSVDSAGKRAAFAGFYAPLHFLVTEAIAQGLGLERGSFAEIVDLGCGTGVAAAAVAGPDGTAMLTGVDRHAWALEETRWNWQQLGLRGRTLRGDMVHAAQRLTRRASRSGPTLTVLGWSINELTSADRSGLRASLSEGRRLGRAVLVIEPISRRAVPWWDEWALSFDGGNTRSDEWAFPAELPESLARLDEAAGFDREALKARSLYAPALECLPRER